MRIVCLSDTHTMGAQIAVPDGDVLVHAGDHTFRGTEDEVREAMLWLESLPHPRKILVAGNHDFLFDERFENGHHFRSWKIERSSSIEAFLLQFPSLMYLQDSGMVIEGVKFFGSPWQTEFGGWAFNFPRLPNGEHDREAAAATWAKIPTDTNVLITHSPPNGILDFEPGYGTLENLGCPELRKRLDSLPDLRLHVFGHLHHSYGRLDYEAKDGAKLTFVNAAINTRDYEPLNAPIIVDVTLPVTPTSVTSPEGVR
ncbi:MAG: metallophosphatase domain-containing protein [Candidatus Cybelea sp.]